MPEEKTEKESTPPAPPPPVRESNVTTAASSIAAMFIRKSLESGRRAEIPSLGIKIEKAKEKEK